MVGIDHPQTMGLLKNSDAETGFSPRQTTGSADN